MRISIKTNNTKITIPIPLFMGTLAIRCIPTEYITKEQKLLAIEAFKIVKKSLKKCKGINIAEVETSNGEKFVIKA